MKGIRAFHLRSGIFRALLVSLVGISLAALSLMWLMAVRHIADNMKAEEVRLMESKLYTVAEDMDNQMDMIRGMVMEVASLQEFRLDYIQDSKYQELEVVKQLKNYNRVTDLSEYYFLKYQAYDNMLVSSGTTITADVFFRDVLKMDDYEKVIEMVNALCAGSKERIVLHREQDMVFLLYPLPQYAASSIGREGVLVFVMTPEKIQQRIERIVGKINGDITVFYNDFCLLGEEDAKQGQRIVAISRTGNFEVYFQAQEDSYFLWKNVFSLEEIMMFAGITIFLLLTAFVMAWWNFRPIEKLTVKYSSKTEENLVPDWDSIDALIESLLRGKEKDSRMLQEQYRLLREQTLQTIVSGGYTERLQEHLTLLNLKLDAPVFGVIQCAFIDDHKMEKYNEALHQKVMDLSGEDVYLYSYWDGVSTLNVLAAVEEEYQLEESMELVQSLFETMELRADMSLVAKVHDLTQFQKNRRTEDEIRRNITTDNSGYSGNITISKGEVIRSEQYETRRNSVKQSTASQVVEYIKEHCTDYDLSLELVAEEFQITSTYLCKIVKQEIGMSYKEYLTGLRIAEAKKLLAQENINVAEVCQRVGYVNVSYFIKVFQRYTGMTPAKYRDEYHS